MEWDRRNSAYLYQFLSGGQLMYGDRLHYEALVRAKQQQQQPSPRSALPSTHASKLSTTAAAAAALNNHNGNGSSTVILDDGGGMNITSHKLFSTNRRGSSAAHQLHQPHSGHQRQPTTTTTTTTSSHQATAADPHSTLLGPAEVLRDKKLEARLLAIKLCWEAVAWSNEGWVWVALSPVFLFLSLFYLDPTAIAKVKCLYIMLLVDILLTGGLKYATKRTRPSYNRGGLFVGPDIFSFPSGHSSRAMLLVHVALFVFGWRTLWSNIAVVCWAMLVAISRLALGRHFLTDVMAGLTLGALEFWATFLVLQHFVFLVI